MATTLAAAAPAVIQSCTACRAVLGGITKRHTIDACPLIKASYCGMCAVYGHSPATCPDRVTRSYRQPQFVEQLIPSSLLEEYGIESCTPLPSTKLAPPPPKTEVLMEVPETDEAVRMAVLAAGGKPMICQEKGKSEKKELAENKKRLQKLADARGVRLVFIATPTSCAAAGAGAGAAAAKK